MKLIEYLHIALEIVGVVGVACAAIASVLPAGKAKTFFGLVGTRLVAAGQSLGKPLPPKEIQP